MALVELVYLVALIGVVVAILALLGEAVASVTRSPSWQAQRFELARPAVDPAPLQVVATVDRRAQPLGFVGKDRRATAAGSEPAPEFASTRA